MTLSVLIPVYGVEKYIERCARSLFEQTLEDIEYVFVDDCSPDCSIEVLLKVLDDYPHRKLQVKVIHNETNLGIAKVRNILVSNASADYVISCDSDDWVEPNMYEEMWKKQQEYGADVVICDIVDHLPGDISYRHITSAVTPQDWLNNEMHKCRSLCNKLIKKSIILDNNLHAKGTIGEDFSVLSRVLYHAKSISFVNKGLYHYDKDRANSATHKMTLQKVKIDQENLEDVIKYFSERDFNWVGVYYTKMYVRANLLRCSPIPWKVWRETYPEVIDIFRHDKSYTKIYRTCYIGAHNGFTLPLIMLKHLPSWKVWKNKLNRLIK